jgi:TRAP-type C4-dicarboxylate transport system permease small subunit
MLILIVLTLTQVFMRYILKISIPWTEEVARLLYGILIFSGVVLLEAENNQIKTTFLLEKLPKKVHYVIQLLINVASMILCGSLIYGATKMVKSSWSITLGSLPWLSSAVTYIVIIVCMPFVIYCLIRQMMYFEEYFLESSEYDLSDIGSEVDA